MNILIYNHLCNKLAYILLILAVYTLMPDLLFARATNFSTGSANAIPSDSSITIAICNVVEQLTGPIGQAISTVAVIFIGIGLFMGKISWGLALGIAVGIAVLFGAENVVSWISGENIVCTGGVVGG